MKILHLLGHCRFPRNPDEEGASGVVRAALELARAQVRLGHEPYVAAITRERWQTTWQGIHLVGLPTVPWARLRFGNHGIDYRRQLSYILFSARHNFDVIQGLAHYYLRFLRANRRVTHFQTDPFYRGKGNESLDLKPADFECIRRFSHVQVAASRFVADQLKRGLGHSANIHVVYNGVDPTLFDGERYRQEREHLRQEWGVGANDVLFLYAGAIVPEKGVIHLARAFARLADTTPGVHLALAGGSQLWAGARLEDDREGAGSDYEREVRRALQAPFLAGRVHFLGTVPASKMPAVYATGDAMVVPSVWREPFGLVALEAMATSRPVIASATGGLVEFVSEASGVQVPPGDEEKLEAALRTLAANPELRHRLGAAGRQRAGQLTWEAAARKLDEIYASIRPTEQPIGYGKTGSASMRNLGK